MKAPYHNAKLNNDKNGNEPNFPPFYEAFFVVETQLRFPKYQPVKVVKHRLKRMKSLLRRIPP